MRALERTLWLVAVLGLAAVALSSRGRSVRTAAAARPPAPPGVRLSMQALHQQGGVPLRWQLTLAPGDAAAGRRTFLDLGCASCHRIAGEPSAEGASSDLGPELTGMGTHHPPAYFAEAILNPDAVLIDAPGYIGADGRSTMPTYPDLTIGELDDLVAYLASLKDGGATPSCHAAGPSTAAALTVAPVDLTDRPQPQPEGKQAFFTQRYDVLPGRLAAFEAWFAAEGRPAFLAVSGLLRVDSIVDVSRPAPAITTTFGFRDETALRNFLGDPATADVFARFDAFVGPHGHHASTRPLVYRAPTLSAAHDDAR